MIDKEKINSKFMIGKAKERFDILRENPYHNLTLQDWAAWYNGWMEGRFQMLADLDVYEKGNLNDTGKDLK
jgi:hypothetical protein